jgi:Arc/MetJ-type ribon-helix-helix transcriptional regulator
MATAKITITLPDGQLDEIRSRVASGKYSSVSGFVQMAVQKSLQNAAEFEAMLDQALMESGGPVTAKERDWARSILSPQKRRTKAARPRKAA